MAIRVLRQTLLRRTALVGAVGAVLMANAARAGSLEFDLPPQPLSRSLDDYARIAGQQVIYSPDLVQGKQAPQLKGKYTAEVALADLVTGSGLSVARTSTGDVMIESAAPAPIRLAEVTRKSPAPTSSIETVVVTAEKKREDIQTVPISVTAMSQKDLTDRQVAAGPDLLREVPNMNFGKTNFSGYSIELRGIGTQAISVTTDPAVAVAFNGIPFIRNHFFEQEFYDVDNIEVLRGPQGTLYGRNATAGVVNLKSALPTDQFEAIASADFGNFNNRRFEGMVNFPIVGDKLDMRFAGEWTKRDGYTTDTTLNAQVDGRDLWSTRASLEFKPADDFEANLIWEHFSEDDHRLRSAKQLCETAQPATVIDGVPVPPVGTNGNVPVGTGGALALDQNYTSQSCQATSLYAPSAFQVPFGPSLPFIIAASAAGASGGDPYVSTTQSTDLRSIQSAISPNYRAKNDTLELNASYNINPQLTLTSETGYNQDFLWSTQDYNRFDTAPGVFTRPGNSSGPMGARFIPDPAAGINGIPASAVIFCDPQLGCSDRIVAMDLNNEHAWQASQEIRLASNFEGPFNFSVGGNYLHYETEENYYVFINALSAYVASGNVDLFGNESTNDNSDCLLVVGGYQAHNPVISSSPLQGCVYMDPNPISSLNNKGHNYFLSQNPYTLNSYALFGEAYYNITDTLKLTGGIRWTVDKKHFVDIPSEVLTDGYGYFVTGAVNQEWDRPTGRVVLNWTPSLDFTDQTLVYGSYSHGYKAGGANPPGAVFLDFNGNTTSNGLNTFPDHPATFKPEYIEAFELGTKNTLLDGSLTLNADVFYYNYTGYQISEIVDRSAINNNYNAHVEGAELESVWEPTPGLKFNFAGGWEDTGVAGGESGIDLMDRTAGKPGWMVLKPFATTASNCILPTYVVAAVLQEQATGIGGSDGGAGPFACGIAYSSHLDPATLAPYAPNPMGLTGSISPNQQAPIPAGYPGFNPDALVNGQSNNNGEGFAKNLTGHQLPNAPPFTLSFGTQYTVPVSSDWAATLRGDFYFQADSWARIFNDNPYDRLRGYTNVNLALILNSTDGWSVMGYVKNIFDTTAITGDFLNSDDSGLTTNVFLTDPRLFGIRVTKDFEAGEGNGGYGVPEFLQGIFADSDAKVPSMWIELGGDAERISGQGQVFAPAFIAANPTSAVLWQNKNPLDAQKLPLFSFGGEAKLSYQPEGTDWVFAAAIIYGRSTSANEPDHQTKGTYYNAYKSGIPTQPPSQIRARENFSDTKARHTESHSILDFTAGKDFGLGLFGANETTTLSAGLRFAQFSSVQNVDFRARPDLHFHTANALGLVFKSAEFHAYHATGEASRTFRGIGPSVELNDSVPLLGNSQGGEIVIDWGVNAAILFGRQKTKSHHMSSGYYHGKYGSSSYNNPLVSTSRSRSVIVPNLGAFAGASYRFNNAKISFGYRGDFFFNALDGGIDARKSETLGFSGPFARISIGLGG